MLLGKFLQTRYVVNPNHVEKYPLSIDLIHVDGVELHESCWS